MVAVTPANAPANVPRYQPAANTVIPLKATYAAPNTESRNLKLAMYKIASPKTIPQFLRCGWKLLFISESVASVEAGDFIRNTLVRKVTSRILLTLFRG